MSAALKLYRHMLDDSDRLMALMILSLHTFLIWGESGAMHTALLLCHYGFFLLWQPLLRQTNKLSWPTTFTILFAAVVVVYFFNWWVIAFWIAGLFALIGGRVLSTEPDRSRLPHILAATYLLAILLLWVVPKLLKANTDLAAAEYLLTYLLPLLPLTILFLSAKNKMAAPAPNIDFFYTLLIFLMTSIVVLGSFAIGVVWQVHYIKLLIIVVLSLAATLVALSWLWNPSAKFSGLELLMSRYLLSLGLPFEQWIRQISTLADSEASADIFLQSGIVELSKLSWVSGVIWQVAHATNQVGEATQFIYKFSFHQLDLTIYSRWQLSPAMYLHVQLLTQILGEFYYAKHRNEINQQNAYMQSLYEAGSRLTHDIKNILQSMRTISAAAEQTEDANEEARLIDLVKKQLPRLSLRLAATLSKLELPSIEKKQRAKVAIWWGNFKALNSHPQVQFETPFILPKTDIDPEVLDSIIDNLLHNALQKAKLDASTQIKVELLATEHFCLEVSDSGEAMPILVAERLFKSHINSNSGLGVGLYHAAQQAAQSGYLLSLADNRHGEVRFRLEILPITAPI
jgi:signal transduction histidine kinase